MDVLGFAGRFLPEMRWVGSTLGAVIGLLGTLGPAVQTAGNGLINCSGENQLQIFFIHFLL